MNAAVPGIPASGSGPQSDAQTVLRTTGLTKQYGARLAVKDLALDVRRGDVFGLLGPNGSGKTTTLRMVLGLVFPTAGEIYLFGERASAAGLKRVGAIAEQPAFYPFLSGEDNLIGVATFAGLPITATTRTRVREALEQVGLGPRGKDIYKRYSLGMKQRLGIAATLLTRPEVIVLDEPTNGLDPAGMVEVRSLIGALAREGVTVLLSSHLLYEVQQVCTRVGILKEGRLLAQGEVSTLLAGSSGLLLGFADAELLPKAAGALLHTKEHGADWIRDVRYALPEPGAWTPPGGWLLRVDAPAERASDVNALLAGYGFFAAELRRSEGSLEQYFLALTSGATTEGSMPATAATVTPAQSQVQTSATASADQATRVKATGGQA